MEEYNFLSDIEKTKIELFNKDKVLVDAIKKVLLKSIYGNGLLRKDMDPDPTRNGALTLAFLAIQGRGTVSNEELGEDLRGLAQGISLMEKGFSYLDSITTKKPEEPEEKANPGV